MRPVLVILLVIAQFFLPVTVSVSLEGLVDHRAGMALWRLNCALLKDREVVDDISEFLAEQCVIGPYTTA